MKKNLLVSLTFFIFAFASQVFAESSAPLPATETPQGSESDSVKETFPKIEWHGSFRYRFEMIDTETADAFYRDRIQAKFGLDSKITEYTKLGFGLATGSPDPISTNQTLDAGFSSKAVGINLAYMEQNYPFFWDIQSTFLLGKFKNPFVTVGGTELIWDNDLNPEGFFLSLDKTWGGLKVFLNSAGFWVEENNAGDDIILSGGQFGAVWNIMENLNLTAASGRYTYSNIEGAPSVFDTTDPAGNSISAAGVYTNGYSEIEGLLALDGKVRNFPWGVFGNVVTNINADNDNLGWLAGFSLGKAKEAQPYQFNYNYRYLEADAVLGAFTDSDFGGGGTDVKGHELGTAYAFRSYFIPSISYFFNQQGVTGGTDFHRLQIDLKYSF